MVRFDNCIYTGDTLELEDCDHNLSTERTTIPASNGGLPLPAGRSGFVVKPMFEMHIPCMLGC